MLRSNSKSLGNHGRKKQGRVSESRFARASLVTDRQYVIAARVCVAVASAHVDRLQQGTGTRLPGTRVPVSLLVKRAYLTFHHPSRQINRLDCLKLRY